jgi:peptidoglycan/LPS O-acetylase OafA/YrhL
MSWNAPGWSLSAEAFFYLVFPLLLMAPMSRWRHHRHLAVMIGCWLLRAGLGGLFLWDFLNPRRPLLPYYSFVHPFFSPLVRLPEFVFGAYLGRYFFERRGGKAPRGLFLAGIVGTVLGFVAFPPGWRSINPFWHTLQPTLLLPFFALIIYGIARGERNPLVRVLSAPWSVLLGEASYAVYILHWPISVAMLTLLHREVFTPVQLLIYLVLTTMVSVATFRYFEDPVRRMMRRRLLARTQT